MRPRSIISAFVAAVLTFGSAPAASAGATPSQRAAPAGVSPVSGVPGFDVSPADTGIDWGGAYAAGARFVFIPATEGSALQYPNFPSQAAGAYNAGLIIGASHFALPNTSGGAAQADYFATHGGAWSADGRTLPGTLDLEYNPYGSTCYGLSQSAMVHWISTFVNEYHAITSRWPIIYTTTDWWTACTGGSGAFGANDPLFIGGYGATPPRPPGWSTYTFWQYAMSGTFPGDQDVFNGTLDELIRFAGNS